MTAPPPGPRPPNAAEREAYILHLQQTPIETIEQQTGLRRPQIAAAIDLARIHTQAAMQTAAADPAPAPAAPPPPARIRMAVMPQLPGATIPPGPARPARGSRPATPPQPVADVDERVRVLTALVDVMRKHEAKYLAELADLLATAATTEPAHEDVDEPPAHTPPAAAAAPEPDLASSPEVRTWATRTGWAVPAAGKRLPGAIVLAYRTAHGGTQ